MCICVFMWIECNSGKCVSKSGSANKYECKCEYYNILLRIQSIQCMVIILWFNNKTCKKLNLKPTLNSRLYTLHYHIEIILLWLDINLLTPHNVEYIHNHK